jgi:hypothetical protein
VVSCEDRETLSDFEVARRLGQLAELIALTVNGADGGSLEQSVRRKVLGEKRI